MAGEPQQLQDGAIDPNVTIPKHIREQAAQADAIHKAAYAASGVSGQPTGEPVVAPADPPAASEPAAPPAQVPTIESPPLQPQHPAGDDDNSDTYKHRFLSMQGRWQASQKQLGEMAQINNDLATELRKTQELLNQNQSQARSTPSHQHPQPGHAHENLITPQDVDNYGNELIDVVSRAARQAVQPEIDALKSQNDDLKRRVITTAQREIQGALTQALPNWVAINRSPEFAQWLALRNIYTGQVRREMLTAAYQAANAPMVVQLFKDFLTEARATGQTVPTTQTTQQQASTELAPATQRQPSVDLGSLAAPGRARPASGDTHVPAEKPIYTRALISKNYADRRRGLWAGRENDWNMLEADMIQAGNEGRVR